MGRAWGPQCEPCPDEGSAEMEALCPTGSGFRPNNRTVSTRAAPRAPCACRPSGWQPDSVHARRAGVAARVRRQHPALNDTIRSPFQSIPEDINECDDVPGLCKHGHCTNTFGSFICSCRDGFRLDNATMMCVDVDECRERPGLCGVGACENTAGSYRCICPDGFVLRPGSRE